jgi:hypothetical protein
VGHVDARGSVANRVSELLPKAEAEAPSKRIWGGTSDAPTWFFRRNPLLRSSNCGGSGDPARTSPYDCHTVGRGSRLRNEPAEKFSGAAMAAIGQKGLPVIVWNTRLYAGITLRWLYPCKRKGR